MVVGAGALGCPALDLLARAGVGRLSIVDRDVVELSNLQRQTLYSEADVGRPKAEAAADRLARVNSSVRLEVLCEDLTPDNALAIMVPHPRPTLVLDCTDNFPARYLLNDACAKLGLPLVYGGAVGTRGVQMTITPGQTACLRCLFPDAPAPGSGETCDTSGILAPVASIIASTQAADAIKLIVSPSALGGTLLSFDLWANRRTRLDLRTARDPACPCCGPGPGRGRYDYLDGLGHQEGRVLCGRSSVQIAPAISAGRGPRPQADLDGVMARLASAGSFARTGSSVSGQLADGTPLTVFADGRAIVGKTTDPAHARAVYARYVGA
jgi:adenylyltransferase/sulfurtransferase